jgi:curli biogenesis system outer membrane secretion channel CsgG
MVPDMGVSGTRENPRYPQETEQSHNYSSEVGIDTNGTVIISSGADVVLTAPVIQLNPGFRVESGAQLLIRAQSVTCPL